MAGLRFEFRGGEKIRAVMVRAARGRWNVPLKAAGLRMIQSITRNFTREGRPRKWRPSRRAIAQGGQTLSDRGFLKAATRFRLPTDLSGKALGLIVFNDVFYGAFHHLGTRKMVRRVFMLYQHEDRVWILNRFSKYIREGK